MEPVLLLLVGLLSKRLRLWAIIALTGSQMLEMTSGYFARTSVLLTFGLVLLYIHEHVRRFRSREAFAAMVVGLLVFFVLHLARLGKAENLDALVGEGIWGRSRKPLRARSARFRGPSNIKIQLGPNSTEANLKYAESYPGDSPEDVLAQQTLLRPGARYDDGLDGRGH